MVTPTPIKPTSDSYSDNFFIVDVFFYQTGRRQHLKISGFFRCRTSPSNANVGLSLKLMKIIHICINVQSLGFFYYCKMIFFRVSWCDWGLIREVGDTDFPLGVGHNYDIHSEMKHFNLTGPQIWNKTSKYHSVFLSFFVIGFLKAEASEYPLWMDLNSLFLPLFCSLPLKIC